MNALREIFAKFGIQFDTRALDAGENRVEALTGSLRDLGDLLLGGTVALGLRSFVAGAEESANILDRYSRTLGITTRDLQAWGAAAGQVGRELDDVVDAMSTVQERARDAVQDPKSDPALQLRLLGVEARGANGELKDGQTLMIEVARGMQALGSQTDRVGAAMTLFGDVGRELLPVLQEVGEDGFEALLARLDAAGGGLSEEFVAAGVEASRASARLDLSLQSLRSRIGVVLLPIVSRLTDGVTGLALDFLSWSKNSKIMEAAMITLGVAGAAAGLKILLPFAPAIATFAALALVIGGVILVVEDLLVALDGGDSVMGRFTESMEDFFEMNRNESGVIGAIAREWEDLVRAVEGAIAVMGEWLGLGPAVEDLSYETTTVRGLRPPSEGIRAGDTEAESASIERGFRARFTPDLQAPDDGRSWWETLTTPAADLYGSSERVAYTSQRGLQPPPSLRQEVTINVNGGSPQEVTAAVRREMDRQLREAADTFGNGGEEL